MCRKRTKFAKCSHCRKLIDPYELGQRLTSKYCVRNSKTKCSFFMENHAALNSEKREVGQ